MTNREIKIAKAILDVLHDLDGRQIGELVLHAEVNLIVPCGATEFSGTDGHGGVLALCDRNKWITGVHAHLTGKMKYNINDAGEAARLEM